MLFATISYICILKDITKTGRFRMMLFSREDLSTISLYGEMLYTYKKIKS